MENKDRLGLLVEVIENRYLSNTVDIFARVVKLDEEDGLPRNFRFSNSTHKDTEYYDDLAVVMSAWTSPRGKLENNNGDTEITTIRPQVKYDRLADNGGNQLKALERMTKTLRRAEKMMAKEDYKQSFSAAAIRLAEIVGTRLIVMYADEKHKQSDYRNNRYLYYNTVNARKAIDELVERELEKLSNSSRRV